MNSDIQSGSNALSTPAMAAAGIIPLLLMTYLIVTSGWTLLPRMDFFDAKRVLEIAVIGFSLLYGLCYRPIRRQTAAIIATIPRWVQAAIALVFIFGLIAAVSSDNPFYGLTEVSLYFSLCILVFLAAASAQLLGTGMLRLMAVFLLVFGSLISLTELIGLFTHWQFGQPATSHSLFLRFSHPRFFNQVQSWLMPLMVLPVFVFSGRRFLQALALINLGFWWALLIYSGGRGSLLGLICALGFVSTLLFRQEYFKRWRNMHVLALLLGIAIYLVMVFVPQYLGGDSSDSIAGSAGRVLANSSGRFAYWQNFLMALLEQPLLGIGPGLSPCTSPETYFAHPHNFYLQLAVEWGVLAGLTAAAVIIFVIQSVVRQLATQAHSQLSIVKIAVATAVLAASIHAIFSGVMVMPSSQVCAVLVFSYLTALMLQPGQKSADTTGKLQATVSIPGSAKLIALPVLLAVAQLAYFLLTDIPQLEFRTDEFVKIYGTPLSPRLWQHGHVCAFVAPEP